MNILVLEDRGSVSHYLKSGLETLDHFVMEAFNPSDAQSYWDKREQVPIDCIIVDLNLPPDGLTEEEKAQSQGGLLSGWLWLLGHVFSELPEMRQRVIIYSDYLAELRKYRPIEEYEDICLIAKRGRKSTATQVLERLKIIEELIR